MADREDVDIRIPEELAEEAEGERLTGTVIQTEDDLEFVKAFLSTEIERALSGAERQGLTDKVQKWRRQREARPESESKDFPWEGASNITPPLSMITGNGIYAMLKASLGTRAPFWTITARDPDFKFHAQALTAFIDALAESRYHLNLRKKNSTILYNLATLGTQFVKIPWRSEIWAYKDISETGEQEDVVKIVQDSPVIVPIRYEDLIMRPFWSDVQRAPWVTHRIRLFGHELRQRAAAGIYDTEAVANILESEEADVDDEQLENFRRMGIEPGGDTGFYEIFETYMYFDVDKDGIPEDIIVWFHPETNSILRTEFNSLGIRPIVRLVYFERPDELYGIGTGWMTEKLQDEIEALHNMRIDGMMLSMLQMYVTKRGGGVPPGLKFRPLLNIQVDDPKNDFVPVKFPDISYGTFQAEMLSKEYADRATAASDAMLGFESKSTSARTTATGTMFLANQGSKLFNSIRESIEVDYSEIGRVVVFQLIRNRARVEEQFHLVDEKHHPYLREALSLSVDQIPALFNFNVHTTEIENTKEAKRQNLLTLSQLYNLYGQQVFQLLPIAFNPNVPPQIQLVAQKFFTGATNLMEEIFTEFGEIETDKYLPYVKNIEMMVQAIEGMQAQQVRAGGGMNVSQNRGALPAPGVGGPAMGPTPGEQFVGPTAGASE